MGVGVTLYIEHTKDAVNFYQEVFGLTLGYHVWNEDAQQESYLHASLMRDGEELFAVSEARNTKLVQVLQHSSLSEARPNTCLGIQFFTEKELKRAYQMIREKGIVLRELGELPWSPLSTDIVDQYGVYWYLYL